MTGRPPRRDNTTARAGSSPDPGMLRAGLWTAGSIFVADQITKWIVLEYIMNPPRLIEVTGFFNFVMVWNRGVSFGLFSNDSPLGPWILSGVAVAISAALLIWMRRAETRLLAISLGCVIGGAIGNVIDRIRFGAVADFLDFHVAGYHWPAFNIADASIVIGVGLILWDGVFHKPPEAE